MKNTLWVLLATAMLLPHTSSAYTYLSGTLPDTLHVEDSPFMVLADVTCIDTHIEAGVEVYFTVGTGIILNDGILSGVGTEADSIWMRGFEGGSWDGIFGDVAYRQRIHLEYVSIDNVTNAIYIGGMSYAEFLNCNFIASSDCIHLDQRYETTTIISGSALTCGSRAIWIEYNYYANPKHVFIDGCTIAGIGLGDKGIYLYEGSSGSTYNISTCTVRSFSRGIAVNNLGGGILTAEGNDIRECTIGIAAGSSNATYEANTVTGNTVGIEAWNSSTFRGNELFSNTEYDVRITSSVGSIASVDFQENDWGPETTAEMHAEGPFSDIEAIYDWWDNNSKSLCDYDNWMTSGVPTQSVTWGSIKASWQEDE